MKRIITIGTLALSLCGCATMQQEARDRAMQSADVREGQAIDACQISFHARDLKTYADQAACENTAVLTAYSEAGDPDMDLVQWMASENMAVATEMDAGTLTPEQGRARLANDLSQVQQAKIQRRNDRDNRRAVAAMMLWQGMQNATAAYRQPPAPSVNCTTNYIANSAYTNCH